QPESVVFHRDHFRISFLMLLADDAHQRGQAGFRDVLLCAQLVDRLAPGGDRQPRAWLRRHAIARPRPRGRGERFRDGVLGSLQVTEPRPQRGTAGLPPPPVAPLHRFRCYSRGPRHALPSSTSLTSTVPYLMIGILPAHSSAVSRSGTSSR